MSEAIYRCPCCGSRTLHRLESMELCPVCWWEDDGQHCSDGSEIRSTVNGEISLREARRNHRSFGAAHPRFVPYVRKATPDEA